MPPSAFSPPDFCYDIIKTSTKQTVSAKPRRTQAVEVVVLSLSLSHKNENNK